MRQIALANPIKIPAPYFERIQIERPRDVVDRVLDREHALRPAKTAERRVRYRVGLAAMRLDIDVLEEIGVIAMEHRAVIHGARQVGRDSAT